VSYVYINMVKKLYIDMVISVYMDITNEIKKIPVHYVTHEYFRKKQGFFYINA